MCEVFVVSGSTMMTFVDFLDMVSAFHPKVGLHYKTECMILTFCCCLQNPVQQKCFHAFQIFGRFGMHN